MKAMCDRDGLLTAFTMVDGVAPARSPKPILQSVKLAADPEEGVVLMATDLEVGIRNRVIGVTIEEPGAVILPNGPTRSILRTSNDQELAIETDGEHLIVRGAHAEFKLTSADPDEFPEVPQFVGEVYHVVAAGDLRKLIRRTVFATDPESTRYALGGVLVELTSESISMVGTDGRRLAKATAQATVEGDWQAPAGTPVIPVKALRLIERNLDDADPPVHIMIRSASEVLVRTERSIIYSRLLEGRFPRYQDAFPKTAGVRVPLDVEQFRRTIEQASVATDDDSRGVEFSFREGVLKLSSRAAKVGSSHVETPVSYSGPQLDLKYDPRYLLDALKTLDGVETASLEVIDHKNAAVIRTDDGYTYLIMPLSRDS